ncbi:uncharacterized protein C8Q71DRAFT_852089 [Rhodofomes roseus]|uniref:Uncharacterized protein n=1 Tax=Rhodofomes roseus TaxID=34475 RepID=A0ABQ8KW68_9APHY|nr:uncharacterized protein C8Q71DRAFT_852089 [Rhodofomes roseus]KAH9843557.1 hypothetical protein C8Q71DRAFT_852089 [Rhodofomes roseus]
MSLGISEWSAAHKGQHRGGNFLTYWVRGHRLFKSTPKSFPVPFVPGDIFDSNHLMNIPPVYAPPPAPAPEFSGLTSLTPLQGHVSAIHAAMFFHLFDEEKQFALAQRLASLLSPLPGSMVSGRHFKADVRGVRDSKPARDDASEVIRVFYHSPGSWTTLWNARCSGRGQ